MSCRWLMGMGFIVWSGFAQVGSAQSCPPSEVEVLAAYLDYATARQNLIEYRQVVVPRERQSVADASEITAAQIRILQRRLADYRPFLAVGEYSPVRTAAENDALALKVAGQNLRHLQDARIAQMRFAGNPDRLYQQQLLLAAYRLQSLLAVTTGEPRQ